MLVETGETKIKRLIAFRDQPPKSGGMSCGACREFSMQLNAANAKMEILTDFETRKTVKLKDVFPGWWGEKRLRG